MAAHPRFPEAGPQQRAGRDLARPAAGRPYLEFTGLAAQAAHEFYHSFARAAERGRQAVELAERHGWTGDPAMGMACTVIAVVLTWQGQPDEAEPWVERAERTLTAEGDSGGPGLTCWRRLPGTRSATPMPPSSAHWTCPSAAASMIMPAQDPKTGIPEATRVCSGSVRPKISASFQIVVDWRRE